MNNDTNFKIVMDPDTMIEIPFTQAVPNFSWYRHNDWKIGEFKRFRHAHTMSQDINGFTFWDIR